jgi:hypothetical protein
MLVSCSDCVGWSEAESDIRFSPALCAAIFWFAMLRVGRMSEKRLRSAGFVRPRRLSGRAARQGMTRDRQTLRKRAMPFKRFKTAVERIFFESEILNIDFSHFKDYVELIVRTGWSEVNGEIFPWKELRFVRFIGVENFSFSYKENNFTHKDNIIPSCCSVNCIFLEENHATIEADARIEITFQRIEEGLLSDTATKFVKFICKHKRSKCFVPPDLESTASLFFEGFQQK